MNTTAAKGPVLNKIAAPRKEPDSARVKNSFEAPRRLAVWSNFEALQTLGARKAREQNRRVSKAPAQKARERNRRVLKAPVPMELATKTELG
jgi:hypothetical protein